MNKSKLHTPSYIFETSWEVCNRVGGIYAVLSTRAASMQQEHPDKVIFFGPDFGAHSDIYFHEDKRVLKGWKCPHTRVGRWNIPGQPIAVLLTFDHLWEQKNDIYAWAWNKFGVQSHAAYGDYDESSLFGYAAGQVMESLYQWLNKSFSEAVHTPSAQRSIFCAHANEWQTAFAIFYLRDHCPDIATLFTTHATGIGRSIAGNGKPLYDYFAGYHGDQMAAELNMVSKHSAEKMAAKWAHCFTTVSDITARECAQLLDKPVDIVTPNGFEPDFVPVGKDFTAKRTAARQALLSLAKSVYAEHDFPFVGKTTEGAFLIGIAGRLEWKNKGIDVFMQSMERLGQKLQESHPASSGEVIAFTMVPYLDQPVQRHGHVTIISIPYYLDGKSLLLTPSAEGNSYSILQPFTYYDLLIGLDLTVFPSYYEPWGYTPLESIAFHVPTITTDVAGFGAWAKTQGIERLEDGVAVIHRTDSNQSEAVEQIAEDIYRYLALPKSVKTLAPKSAAALAKKAEWSHFFDFYRQAYDFALRKLKNTK